MVNPGIIKPHMKSIDRCMKVLEMRRAGMTLQSIGSDLGLSAERIRQMSLNAERFERQLNTVGACLHMMLSARARNGLLAKYWTTQRDEECCEVPRYPPPAMVRRWLESGELRSVPNMGRKSIQEVADWLVDVGSQCATK